MAYIRCGSVGDGGTKLPDRVTFTVQAVAEYNTRDRNIPGESTKEKISQFTFPTFGYKYMDTSGSFTNPVTNQDISGQTSVTLVSSESTLKTYYHQGHGVYYRENGTGIVTCTVTLHN